MLIQDGRGTRYAFVNQRQELRVQAVAARPAFVKALAGETFAVASGFQAPTVTGGRAFWVKNNEQTRLVILHKMYWSWNGGSTNHNRVLKVTYYMNDTEPTTNVVASAAAPTRLGSLNSALVAVKVWNGVGDGYTGHTAGTAIGFAQFPQAYAQQEVEDTFILSPGMSLSVHLQGEEAGVSTFGARFFMYDGTKDEW